MTVFARSWKALVCRGILGIAFGFVALSWPGMSLPVLVLLFGVYALFDGIAAIAIGTGGVREHSWAFLLEGFAGLGIALAIFLWARMAVELMVLLIAFWAVSTGIFELVAAIRLRRELPSEVLLGVAGAASIVLGFSIFFWPTARALAMVVLLGSYALVFGAAMLLQAFRIRRALHSFRHDDQDFGAKPGAV